MGSPLGSILAGIIMDEQEKSMAPRLQNHISFWKRYIDDTFTCVKDDSITFVLEQLNSRSLETPHFRDVLVIRKNNKFERSIL